MKNDFLIFVFVFYVLFVWNIFETYDSTIWASLIAQVVKNPPVIQETVVLFLGQGDPLEKG